MHLMRQRPAICVAQNNPARTRIIGCFGGFERVIWIIFEPVEKMFSVEQGFMSFRHQMFDAFGDVFEVFIQRSEDLLLEIQARCAARPVTGEGGGDLLPDLQLRSVGGR